MFPKFLRVVTQTSIKNVEKFNETTTYLKTVPLRMDQKLLDVIAKALGFSYEVVAVPDGRGFGERLPNGSWTKALGMIQRGEADLLIGPLGVTEERHEAFRLSYPFAVDEVTFVTRNHEYVPNPAILLNIFSIETWLSIIACIFLVSIAFHFLLRRKHSAVDLFTSSLATLVAQGIGLTPQIPREHFVLASWILGSSLLYYFYTAFLFSFLTFPSMEGIKTIEDLANGIKDGYHLETYETAIYADVFSNQQNWYLQVIGNELEKSEGVDYFVWYFDSTDDRKIAFVGLRSDFNTYKDFYFISDENFLSSFLSFATHEEFCCSSELDKVINRIWASKIYEKLLADESYLTFLDDLRFFLMDRPDPPSDVPLTMTVLKGPFIFLIVFHSLAFFIFLLEVCVGKCKSI